MSRTDRTGGAREQRLPDWVFGGPGRRLLLDTLLRQPPNKDGWAKKDLEKHARVEHGGLDTVLPGALQLGLIRRIESRWHPGDSDARLNDALRKMLAVTDRLPDEEIEPLPRRTYRRRSA